MYMMDIMTRSVKSAHSVQTNNGNNISSVIRRSAALYPGLIETYEEKNVEIPDASGADVLRLLMESNA
jgi:hypothetical protein